MNEAGEVDGVSREGEGRDVSLADHRQSEPRGVVTPLSMKHELFLEARAVRRGLEFTLSEGERGSGAPSIGRSYALGTARAFHNPRFSSRRTGRRADDAFRRDHRARARDRRRARGRRKGTGRGLAQRSPRLAPPAARGATGDRGDLRGFTPGGRLVPALPRRGGRLRRRALQRHRGASAPRLERGRPGTVPVPGFQYAIA